ncbi:hypothetical protein [Devosia sp.]|uniref:hypothetical protein n=1 Tax=Devosia sp. TaxID=1871048 RepID=UPI001ACC4C8D|nr:hypothetical protein [Devosia sp.]MBN9334703.1 hypothetical protein [Devosia sp.]
MNIVVCRCCNPGCIHSVRLVPFATVMGFVDLTEGLCRDCLEQAAPDRRALLATARLELRLTPGLAQIVLLVRAWDAVKMSVAERSSRRAA